MIASVMVRKFRVLPSCGSVIGTARNSPAYLAGVVKLASGSPLPARPFPPAADGRAGPVLTNVTALARKEGGRRPNMNLI